MENLKSKIIGAFLFLLILQFPDQTLGQRSIEVHVGIGYTSVGLEAWAGTNPIDWNQTMYQIDAQYFFSQFGNLSVRVKFGYQYFFWYEIIIPFGSTSLRRTREADANQLMAVSRYKFSDKLYADIGLGTNSFEGGTDIGLSGALGYRFQVNQELTIPVKFKTGLILDSDANLLPLGITIGFAYML